MRFLLTKTCEGVFDTGLERKRITNVFRRDPETRAKLLELMDAIETGRWQDAVDMLESEWWNGRDAKRECPRAEFIGMVKLESRTCPGHPAYGFDYWATYAHLVWKMSQPAGESGCQYSVVGIPSLQKKRIKKG